MACFETDSVSAFEPNVVHELLECYTYGLVSSGTIQIRLGGDIIEARRGDMIIYMPGLDLRTVGASADYRAQCMMVTADFAHDNAALRMIMQTAYFPIMHLHRPVFSLTAEQFDRVSRTLTAMEKRIAAQHTYKADILQSVYSVFLFDLMHIQQSLESDSGVSPRYEHFFISFIRELQTHYREHHDIRFYADRLHISPAYLSRIVRAVTGRTVIDFVNQLLLIEACRLLRNTDLTATQIADRLHFADQSSFSKFFARKKGVWPKKYRMER